MACSYEFIDDATTKHLIRLLADQILVVDPVGFKDVVCLAGDGRAECVCLLGEQI